MDAPEAAGVPILAEPVRYITGRQAFDVLVRKRNDELKVSALRVIGAGACSYVSTVHNRWGKHMTTFSGKLDELAAAVEDMNPGPRSARWAHLSLCVLDATFSINARYDTVVAPLVWRYAKWAELQKVLLRGDELIGAVVSPRDDEQKLSAFLKSFEGKSDAEFASDVVRNRNRTSSRGGVLKTEAARRISEILTGHGVETLSDVSALLTDLDRTKAVERALAAVRGHGTGIRTSYIWMLAGDDKHVKPDRHVLGWLSQRTGRNIGVPEARAMLADIADILGLTPWSVDHAIWASKARRRAV